MAALDALEGRGARRWRDARALSASAMLALIGGARALLARIAELEDETRSLAGLTEEVEDRLDGAIAEIRTALGR